MTIIKRQTITSVREEAENTKPLYIVSGNIKGYTLKNNLAVPQMLNIESPYDPAIPLLGMYTKEMKTCPSKKKKYTNFHSTTIQKYQENGNNQMSINR